VILLALPVHTDTARMIVQMCLGMKNRSEFRFLAKLHPIVKESLFFEKVPEAQSSMLEFVGDPLNTYFDRTAVLVSGDSSACFEASLSGIRVVIAGNRSGPTSNPLSGIMSSDGWRICYDSDCLSDVLSDIHQPLVISKKSRLISVTKKSVDEFVSL